MSERKISIFNQKEYESCEWWDRYYYYRIKEDLLEMWEKNKLISY